MTEVQYAEVSAVRIIPLHRQRPNPYVYGYGSRIPTIYEVQVGVSRRWRRVWAWCYSNVAVHYCIVHGEQFVVRDEILQTAKEENHE